MRVTRADWAMSVPWSGISGKPDSLSGSNEDIDAKLDRIGARLSAIEALLSQTENIPTITTASRILEVGTLEPHQAYSELISFPGVSAGTLTQLSPTIDTGMCVAFCGFESRGNCRVTIYNAGQQLINLGSSEWRFTFLTNG